MAWAVPAPLAKAPVDLPAPLVQPPAFRGGTGSSAVPAVSWSC